MQKHITSTFQHLQDAILDMVFPMQCITCDAFVQNQTLCTPCRATLPIKTIDTCLFCTKAYQDGRTCGSCRRTKSLDQRVAVSSYAHTLIRTIIKKLKYRLVRATANDMAHAMVSTIVNKIPLTSNTVLVPVPLHIRRLRWRGFNQAALIAQHMSTALQLPYAEALIRTAHRKPQADIQDRSKRIANVANIFALASDSNVTNKDIILIDDVTTTGATLDACAKVLKANGASTVRAAVFAHD